MKNLKTFKLVTLSLLLIGAVSLTSCGKYKSYDNMGVIDNTYPGSVEITSVGADPAGDFAGVNESGEYSFAWENKNGEANANFDITGSGTVQMIIYDSKGNEVLNGSRTGGQGEDSFSGVSSSGKKGMWKVSLIYTNFNGSGSFSVSPGN